MKARKTAAKKAVARKATARQAKATPAPARKISVRRITAPAIAAGRLDAVLPALNARLAELNARIEATRVAEVEAAAMACRQLVEAYGLTAADVGLTKAEYATTSGASSTPGAKKASAPIPAKYANPETGETWSGRGRAPGWINGQDRSQFLMA